MLILLACLQSPKTTPSAELINALSHRDGAPACASLGEEDDLEFQLQLVNVVQTIEMPPWAPMNAAGCLMEMFPTQSRSLFRTWLEQEDTKGLAIKLALQMDQLPLDLQLELVPLALSGPHSDSLLPRLERNATKEALDLLPTATQQHLE